MHYEDLTIRAADGYSLSARWFDCASPNGILQIIHGMEEHKERYDDLAAFLQQNGFSVLTCDLRGHGASAPVLSHIADKNGADLLVSDVQTLTACLRKWYPDEKKFLLAHSMGSIIARKLLQTDSRAFDKVILSGYPYPQAAAGAGILLAKAAAILKGPKGHSKLLDQLALGGFSNAFPNAQTPVDWLSFDRENVRKYMEDPLCGVPFTIASYEALFRLLRDIGSPEKYREIRSDLSILLLSGRDDPCTGGEKGRRSSLEKLSKAGFTNLQVKTLDHMRHETLNETGRDAVYRLILAFLTS